MVCVGVVGSVGTFVNQRINLLNYHLQILTLKNSLAQWYAVSGMSLPYCYRVCAPCTGGCCPLHWASNMMNMRTSANSPPITLL